jgi:hypothetical protein
VLSAVVSLMKAPIQVRRGRGHNSICLIWGEGVTGVTFVFCKSWSLGECPCQPPTDTRLFSNHLFNCLASSGLSAVWSRSAVQPGRGLRQRQRPAAEPRHAADVAGPHQTRWGWEAQWGDRGR